MPRKHKITDLAGLLDQLDEAAEDREDVSIGAVLDEVGQRSFGPVLLVPGIVALSPLSGIPGTPTAVGLMVLLFAGQMLIGRSEFWVPGFVRRRSISRPRFEKAIRIMRPVARFVDRLTRPRLTFLTGGAAVYVIAAVCLLLSLITPLLEVLPFAITGVGAALTAFGLALISDDGILAILALAACIGTAVMIGLAMF